MTGVERRNDQKVQVGPIRLQQVPRDVKRLRRRQRKIVANRLSDFGEAQQILREVNASKPFGHSLSREKLSKKKVGTMPVGTKTLRYQNDSLMSSHRVNSIISGRNPPFYCIYLHY